MREKRATRAQAHGLPCLAPWPTEPKPLAYLTEQNATSAQAAGYPGVAGGLPSLTEEPALPDTMAYPGKAAG